MNNLSPLISIGMPVYNAEGTIRAALDSLLQQTFKNFELIISDNCSTDGSAVICQEYADKDDRIRFFRQEENLGGLPNFKFVFDKAEAEYFMWSASDDIRSSDFLAVNHKFLTKNLDYVMSTSPNWFENWGSEQSPIDFTLKGDAFNRFSDFFKYSFKSHGLFYSLFRTKILRECKYLDQIFPGFDWLAFDWATILCLANKGRVNRSTEGCTTFGVNGESSDPKIFKKYNTSILEWFFPFYRLSKIVIDLVRDFTFLQRLKIYFSLMRLNVYAKVEPLRMWSFGAGYRIYKLFFKPVIKIFVDK